MAIDKEFYNAASGSKLDWTPEWFGCSQFDEELTKAIRAWQKARGLTADGLCGPSTYRRVSAEREADIDEYKRFCPPEKDQSFIVHAGNFIPINWPKVVLWSEPGGLKSSGGYSKYTDKKRDIKMFVNHWDVCLNSKTCSRVLNKRGISVHFMIDNDGTIFQAVDMKHAAWHAGSKKWNHSSVGVEISNAYYQKYQPWYKRNGFGERPLMTGDQIHGKTSKDFLGFYPVQLEALKALWEACHEGLDIPYQTPLTDGKTSTTTDAQCVRGTFRGFVSHYHLTKRKIDCTGLDIENMLVDLRKKEK